MGKFLDRSIKLLGEEKIKTFENKVILLCGLGGVGGTALEALARSGFKHFILVDFDTVDESNLNRQILYTFADVEKAKTDVAKQRILSINPDAQIEVISKKITKDFFNDFNKKVDFVVDAIDFVEGKLAIISYALANNIPLISCLGMGNRIDPSKVKITKLNKTEGDPLARKLRYECRQLNLDLSKINVVFSSEEPLIVSKEPGSMMMVPSCAGLEIAKFIIGG